MRDIGNEKIILIIEVEKLIKSHEWSREENNTKINVIY